MKYQIKAFEQINIASVAHVIEINIDRQPAGRASFSDPKGAAARAEAKFATNSILLKSEFAYARLRSLLGDGPSVCPPFALCRRAFDCLERLSVNSGPGFFHLLSAVFRSN